MSGGKFDPIIPESSLENEASVQPSSRRRAVRAALIYVAAWLPLFMLHTVMLWRSIAPDGLSALKYASAYFIPAMAAGGFIWQRAKKISWARLNTWSFIACEVGLALAFLLVWQILFYGFLVIIGNASTPALVSKQSGGGQYYIALLIYAIQAAIFHLLRLSRERRVRDLAAAQTEAQLIRVEMEALRGQLNPHFLFNSLHSITALVRDEPRKAEDALLQFATLLRRVMETKRATESDEVTLDDEISFVEDYLAIERLRLGDRLRATISVAEAAKGCWLPAFSIQPLVENAIRYAIAPRRNGGSLMVEADNKGGQLVVDVRDDGSGGDSASAMKGSGIGMSLIRRRIALRHGPDASLTVLSKSPQGFHVRLTVPATYKAPTFNWA